MLPNDRLPQQTCLQLFKLQSAVLGSSQHSLQSPVICPGDSSPRNTSLGSHKVYTPVGLSDSEASSDPVLQPPYPAPKRPFFILMLSDGSFHTQTPHLRQEEVASGGLRARLTRVP